MRSFLISRVSHNKEEEIISSVTKLVNCTYGMKHMLHYYSPFLMEHMSKLNSNTVQVIVQIYTISNLSPQLYLLYKSNNRTPTWHKTVKVNTGYFTFGHNSIFI